MSDPPRLLDDPDVPVELGDDLRRAAETPSQLHDAEAGLALLRASIGATGAGAAAAATSSTVLPTLGAIAAVVAVGVTLGWIAWGPSDPPSAATPAAPSATTPAPPSATGVEPTEDAVRALPPAAPAPAEPSPSATLPTAPTPVGAPEQHPPSGAASEEPPARPPAGARRTGPTTAPSPTAPMDPDQLLRLETAQLARVRQLLDADPAAALRLADEGQRRFRGGMFGEEREALAVLALDRLGRGAAARRRGAAFLRRHPAGPFSAEIRQLLETP